MLQITKAQVAALEAGQRQRFTFEVMRRLRAIGDPAIAIISDPVLAQRVDAGLQVGSQHGVSEERDLMLLALAYALFGIDMLTQADKGFVAEILRSVPGTTDNRMFRVYQGLG